MFAKHHKNYNILMKGIKMNQEMKRQTTLMDWKTQYCKDVNSPQTDLDYSQFQ